MRSSSSRSLALPLLSFVALGLPDGMIGPSWPAVRSDLGVGVSALGVLAGVWIGGAACASAANGILERHFGSQLQAIAGLAVAAVALGGFAVAPSWAWLLVAGVAGGFGSGLLDSGTNTALALRHGPRELGALHACFGAGAMLGPLVVVAARAMTSWRLGFGVVGALDLMLALALLRARTPASDRRPQERTPPSRRLDWTLLALVVAVFFVYTGLELGVGQWAYTFLVDQRGVGSRAATLWVVAFWGSFTLGRLALGAVTARLSPQRALAAGTATTLVGAALLWSDPGGLGVLALPLLGLATSVVFPLLVALAPSRFGEARAPAAIGVLLAAATLGGAVLTGASGAVVHAWGLGALGPLFFAAACVVLVLDAAASRRSAAL